MNCLELQEALDAHGVNRNFYSLLEGQPFYGGRKLVALDKRGDMWVVSTARRGKDYDQQYFETEDEACQYLLRELL